MAEPTSLDHLSDAPEYWTDVRVLEELMQRRGLFIHCEQKGLEKQIEKCHASLQDLFMVGLARREAGCLKNSRRKEQFENIRSILSRMLLQWKKYKFLLITPEERKQIDQQRSHFKDGKVGRGICLWNSQFESVYRDAGFPDILDDTEGHYHALIWYHLIATRRQHPNSTAVPPIVPSNPLNRAEEEFLMYVDSAEGPLPEYYSSEENAEQLLADLEFLGYDWNVQPRKINAVLGVTEVMNQYGDLFEDVTSEEK